ncbi:phenazine biosynthesis protein PhzF [Acinetobacter sp. NCu2D-2]|uniref:PhzF family phenazine biosynthesis protein n=1 Tax=Acinetobacter sp. NCu2D-2 TaxID=1608473 RepID=UPI0007CDB451|nr:PhzF family phenazine biosynthesis protein [Acinetobacter sp. NCu2D-2]ANF81563.1 phenazine biosynthesis protein PhzF [Acinetobacter sp. NCu2D-2]
MKMYQVDAFTTELFKGNPAAVVVTNEWLEDDLMQNIAFENNLAETAFVRVVDDTNYEIRWFTPKVEVDFCGHATLASSFVLFKDYTAQKTIQFHVKDLGIFVVTQDDDGKIRMNFPVREPVQIDDYPELLNELVDVPFEAVYVNPQAFILVCKSAEDVKRAQPNFEKIAQLAHVSYKSTAITAADLDLAITSAEQSYDYIARYFAPHKGINEDPVTGSMHTGLAPLWAKKLNKTALTAYQASARGGILHCELKGEGRIEVAGYGKLYMIAELYL